MTEMTRKQITTIHTALRQMENTQENRDVLGNLILQDVVPGTFGVEPVKGFVVTEFPLFDYSTLTVNNFTMEDLHTAYTEHRDGFNRIWWASLDKHNKALTAFVKQDTKVAVFKKSMIDLASAEAKLAEATRKQNEKDIARATRRVENATQQGKELNELEKVRTELLNRLMDEKLTIALFVNGETMARLMNEVFNPEATDTEIFEARRKMVYDAALFVPDAREAIVDALI